VSLATPAGKGKRKSNIKDAVLPGGARDLESITRREGGVIHRSEGEEKIARVENRRKGLQTKRNIKEGRGMWTS